MKIEEKIDRYLNEGDKLKNRIKKSLNKKLNNLLSKTFDEIPFYDIRQIINRENLTLIDEDGRRWSGFLRGDTGSETFGLETITTSIVYDNKFKISWKKKGDKLKVNVEIV